MSLFDTVRSYQQRLLGMARAEPYDEEEEFDFAPGEFLDFPENLGADRGKNRSVHEDYWVYTKRFDLEVRGERLHKFLKSETGRSLTEMRSMLQARPRLQREMGEAFRLDAIRQMRLLYEELSPHQVRNTVLTLLIDHSGSTRGRIAETMLMLAEGMSAACNDIGLSYEILGFTTTAWKGGRSRRMWIEDGRPADPGRLNDVLHIIYRSADDMSHRVPWSLQYLLRDALLKENIDGEAVEWAAKRLLERPERRRKLVVVSDGAPVDDSTMLENHNSYLWNHLVRVVDALEQDDEIDIAGMGMAYDVGSVYAQHVHIANEEALSSRALPFLFDFIVSEF